MLSDTLFLRACHSGARVATSMTQEYNYFRTRPDIQGINLCSPEHANNRSRAAQKHAFPLSTYLMERGQVRVKEFAAQVCSARRPTVVKPYRWAAGHVVCEKKISSDPGWAIKYPIQGPFFTLQGPGRAHKGHLCPGTTECGEKSTELGTLWAGFGRIVTDPAPCASANNLSMRAKGS